MKHRFILILFLCVVLMGCAPAPKQTTMVIAVASSLESIMTNSIFPLFHEQHPDIILQGVYGSSGALQVQIEQGLAADVFCAAAEKPVKLLQQHQHIASSIPWVSNALALITSKGSNTEVTEFSTAPLADSIALGDPAYVPVGMYAKDAFLALQNWDSIERHATYASNATEVLGWVAAGNAEVGVVYNTDVMSRDDILVLDTYEIQTVYPVAILREAAHPTQAQAFVDFLQTPAIIQILLDAGFTSLAEAR